MRLLRILPIVLLASLHAPAFAESVAPETPTAIYGHAMHALKIGHNYERAIQQLRYLIAQDPKNRDYHLALGCAEADRTASLGYAAMWTKILADERTRYPETVKDWDAAQHDPKSDSYSDARPTPPPDRSFETKDDDYPLALTVPQAIVRINLLVHSAQEEWKRALALSVTPSDRAEVNYVQGWGIELLLLLQTPDFNGNGDTPILRDNLNIPIEKEAGAAFTAATKAAPDNAVYWQSLGDSLYKQPNAGDPVQNAKALIAYNKSLTLQPVNALLWFRLYQMYNQSPHRQLPLAMDALSHTIDNDPENAYPHYLMAGILFRSTHYNDPHDKTEIADREKALTADYDLIEQHAADSALTQIEQGNAATRNEQPEYVHPYPEVFSGFGIWKTIISSRDMPFTDYAYLRELSRAAGGYARIAAAHGDHAGAERGAYDVIAMGLKLCGDWPIEEKQSGGHDVIHTLLGEAIAMNGYNDLVKSEAQMGNTEAAQQAQMEYGAFKAQYSTYREAAYAKMNARTIYDDY